ncbi:MAG: hypothetical protein P4L39_07180 [Humidesulfovibrio sp.]|nr:hypothetical protein [Humidesulfovibrio sp.]
MTARTRCNVKWTTALPLLGLLQLSILALSPGAGWAQNSVRVPVEPPLAAQPQKPVPMQILPTEGGGAVQTNGTTPPASAHKSKFPNIDTAKNRQDNELGTDSSDDSITIGRDEKTGETVMRHRAPVRQQQQQTPFENQPIQVRPIIPLGGQGSSGR